MNKTAKLNWKISYKEIINKIDFTKIKKGNGIYEFPVHKDLSLGISLEDEDGEEVYIYNLFLADTYINISNRGTRENKYSRELLTELYEETPKEYKDLIK